MSRLGSIFFVLRRNSWKDESFADPSFFNHRRRRLENRSKFQGRQGRESVTRKGEEKEAGGDERWTVSCHLFVRRTKSLPPLRIRQKDSRRNLVARSVKSERIQNKKAIHEKGFPSIPSNVICSILSPSSSPRRT